MYLYVNGGLGNQLFQLTYANFVSENRRSEIVLVPQNIALTDRDFLLGVFLENYPNLKIGKVPTQWSVPIDIFKRLPTGLAESKTIQFLNPLFTHPSAYAFEDSSGKPVQFGYFQNKGLLLRSERNPALAFHDSLKRNFPHSSLKDKNVLHIRGGDLHKYRHSMGVLDIQYYVRAIEGMNVDISKLVVVTDDLVYAKSICEVIGVSSIIGPRDLSVLESFALMAFSRNLVCANSTFSWWAGVVSLNHGGRVFFPKPWFLDWHEISGDSFDYPGFSAIPSAFIL